MPNTDDRSSTHWRARIHDLETAAGRAGRPRQCRSGRPTDGEPTAAGHSSGTASDGSGRGRPTGETDGGSTEEASPTLATYTDEASGYSLAYPADWLVEPDPDGGVTFEAPGARAVGAVVFVDEAVVRTDARPALAAYVEAFLDDLDADGHVHALDVTARWDATLTDGRLGRVVECAYVGDAPGERWRLTYLFVVADDTGYTVGVDWNDTEAFDAVAAEIIASFVLGDDDAT